MTQLQFDLERGKELKEEGQDRVTEHNPSFVEVMRHRARVVARVTGRVTSDDLRRYANEIGMEPEHPNAWGAVFRGREWEQIGFVNSEVASNHSRVIRVWKLKGGGDV